MTRIGLRFNESANVIQQGDMAEPISFDRLLVSLRRQRTAIAICACLGVLMGIFYLATTPQVYWAEAQVLVDNRVNKIVEQAAATADGINDDAGIQNEIHVVKSAPIARQVVDKLDLANNQSFRNPPESFIGKTVGGTRRFVSNLLGGRPAPQTPSNAVDDAAYMRELIAQNLQKSIRVTRVGQSYVLSIGYVSHDPKLAADITNAFANAYLDDQLNANLETTERTLVWMQDQLSELAISSQQAALETERFRADNNLTATEGQLITEQRLDQLNTQLALAEADAAKAEAMMQRFQTLIDRDPAEIINPGELVNTTDDMQLAELETRYSNVSSRLEDVITQFGPEHPQALILIRQQQELSGALRRELTRIYNEVSAEAQIEEARVNALRQSVAGATMQNAQATQAQVELQNLEKRADALASIYQNFLSQYQAIEQQQSFPVTNFRILVDATLPRDAAGPRKSNVLMTSLVLGLLLGLAVMALREFRERFFRTAEDVETETDQNFLGYLPLPEKSQSGFLTLPFVSKPKPVPSLDLDTASRVLREPRSVFAETLRNVRFALGVTTEDNTCKVLGITSALPGEGKSTVSSNLALLLAMSGHKTLLIDADIRNPGLTRALNIPRKKSGILTYLMGDETLENVIIGHDVEKLHIVPCFSNDRLSHYTELLSSKRMQVLLATAQQKYSYVIVDLPPLSPVVDAKVIEPLLQKFLLVAAWGDTPRGLLRQQLRLNPKIAQKSLGVVLNKVDMNTLQSYAPADTSDAYINTYSGYHTT
ncbi:polysaccharide biosynthesis tyrosine autokinase [Parasulfitobacter algicola]|uniref:non-specific protein-tyrosine kinase n=1 Tax=Parasulfitobacter algicola TaxID=2614809 RepID=A0ABX2ISA0_9RHOB|nr:polysaccharide biosynthesis tyrosine autokinase [Sulfitobacter algicola]NSX54896.1 polysaccharide biosynthesis tyrosine autokinase [Sulfitobacter algicola]